LNEVTPTHTKGGWLLFILAISRRPRLYYVNIAEVFCYSYKRGANPKCELGLLRVYIDDWRRIKKKVNNKFK
jgi:hypothetical protein